MVNSIRAQVVNFPRAPRGSLQNYSELVEADALREVVMHLVRKSSEPARQAKWTEPVSVETVFLDSTAVELEIHHPVDWVLLRDGVRNLVKAMILIRKQGLQVRMDEPATFLRGINKLCMQMTAVGKRSGDKKGRKKVLCPATTISPDQRQLLFDS